MKIDIDLGVSSTVMKMVSSDPNVRFESCTAFLEGLQGGSSSSQEALDIYSMAVKRVLADGRIEQWEKEQVEGHAGRGGPECRRSGCAVGSQSAIYRRAGVDSAQSRLNSVRDLPSVKMGLFTSR